MAELVNFNSFEQFLEFNDGFIRNDYYAHYYLISFIEKILNGTIGIYNFYNIEGRSDQRILAVHIDGGYLLYGANWDEEMMSILSNQIDLKRCTVNFSLSGNRSLVLSLFKRQNSTFEIFKERLVYECRELKEVSADIAGGLELCTFRDLKTLSQLAYTYHIDEYGGQGFHSFEKIKKRVEDGIRAKTYYLFRDGNKICCMAQVFNKESGYPFIGGVVTDRTLRNKGYATAFMYDLTEMVMEEGFDRCGLVSDVANAGSNKVFRKVGYVPIYEYISMHTLNPSAYS